jgi:type II secretory pathway pseudopilin PulG
MTKAFTLLELIFIIVIVGVLSTFITSSFQQNTLQEAANQLLSHIRYTQYLALNDNKFNSRKPTWFKERWQIQFKQAMYDNQIDKNSIDIWAYTIYSDTSNHDANPNISDIIASDPLNPVVKKANGGYKMGTYLSGGFKGIINGNHKGRNKKLALQETYGVQAVKFSSSCSYYGSKRVIFDAVGRPYYNYKKDSASMVSNPFSNMKLIKSRCIISLCLEKDAANKCDFSDKSSFIQLAVEAETGYTHIL